MAIERKEYYISRTLLIEMGGFHSSELTKFMNDKKIVKTNAGIPVLSLIKALNESRRQRTHGDEEDSVDVALKREKVIEMRLKNAERSKDLISKEFAKGRVQKTFTETAIRMRYQIKTTSVKVAPITSARDCEVIMTNDYNDIVEELDKASLNIRWEDERATGIESESRGTELVEDSGENFSSSSGE